MARKLIPIAVAAAAACSAPAADEAAPVPAERAAAAPERRGAAEAGEAEIRLARLPDSRMGEAATTGGILQAQGRCLYLAAPGGARYLIASTMAGARWDAGQGALVVPGAGTFRPGDRVSLGGAEAGAATLAGRWLDPPAAGCDTARIWVANSVSRAGG